MSLHGILTSEHIGGLMGIFSRYRNYISIRQKIMFVIAISICITLLITVGLFYTVIEFNNHQLFEQVTTNILLATENLDQKFTTIQQFSSVIVSDKGIQSLLINLKDIGSYTSFGEAIDGVNTILSIYHDQLKDHYVKYLLIDGQGVSSGTYTPKSQVLPDSIKADLVARAQGSYGSFYVTEFSDEHGIFLVYPIRRFIKPRFDYLGTLIIAIDPKQLFSSIVPEQINLSQIRYVLFDQLFNTIYSSAETFDTSELLALDYEDRTYSVLTLAGESFMVIGKEIFLGWKFFTLLPYRDLLRMSNLLRMLCILLVSAVGLLSIRITYNILRNSFSKPIHELVVHMKTFGTSIEPLAAIKDHFIDRGDEIGDLYTNFEKMTRDIVHLVDVNYKNELLYKESQLRYLQAQIHPHFLFNTLDSISWRAKLVNDSVTTNIVESLSVLLRGSLNTKKRYSLKEEIELVKHYLNIQQIRYGDQLSYTLHCPDELLGLCFPHMVLQPIIENAIKYSLEMDGEQCHIHISAAGDTQVLSLRIQNSGSQFEEDHLHKLENEVIKTSGFGIGLLNIQKRIQLDYGDAYGLYLFNDDEHAVVQVTIPYIHVQEDDENA